MYFMYTRRTALEAEVDRVEEEITVLEVDRQAARARADRLVKRVDTLKERFRDSPSETRKGARDARLKETRELEAALEAMDDAYYDLHCGSKTAALRRIRDKLHRESIIAASLVSVGIFLSCVGFMLWYRKLQRWQDAAVRKAAHVIDSDT